MSVSTTTTTLDYTGDGVTNKFVIPFPYLDKSHVYVSVGADVNNLGAQAQGVDFTIDLEGPQGTNDGTITMTVAPANTYVVRVYRVVPLTQPTDLRAQGNFSAATHENALDRLTMIAQQLNAGALVAETIVTGAQLDSATTPTAVTAATGTPGVSEKASPADHRHQVTTAAASSLTPDGANSAGVSNSLARADHHHKIATYSSTPAAIGTAAAGTSGFAPARGDHVHAHGDQLGGTLHADVTTTTDGFMVAADKQKLDAMLNPLYEFFDDFNGGSSITDTGSAHDKWDVTLVGTGTITPSTTEEYGAVDLVTSAGGTDSVMLTSGLLASPERVLKFACRIKIPSTANIRVQVGLTTSTALAEFDQFDLDPANHGGSTNWWYETDRTATQSANSAIAVSGAWQELEFVQSADTSVAFYIGGTLVGTHSTAADMPLKAAPLRAFIKVTNTSAASKTITVDFIRVRWSGSGRATSLVT